MANVLVEQQSLVNVGNAIREVNGTDNTYKPSEMAQAIIDTKGKSLIDFLESKTILNMALACSNVREIKFNINPLCTNINYMCSECKNLEKIELENTSNVTLFEGAFFGCRKLREIGLPSTANAKTIMWAFASCDTLEVVNGILDFSKCNDLTGVFNGISNIRELRFAENSIHADLTLAWADKLSDETIQSIINGLADLTGQTSHTITFHSTVTKKLTDEQKQIISQKGWKSQ